MSYQEEIIRVFSPQRHRGRTEFHRGFLCVASVRPLCLCGEIVFALVLLLCLFPLPLQAQKQSKQAKAAQRAAEQRYEQAVVLLKQNNPARAAAEFRAVLQTFPTFAEAHNGLGMALGQQGQADDAIAAFQQAISMRQFLNSIPRSNSNLIFTKRGFAWV
jgi:tetratricopeptide (TPR) repeat protein